VSLLSGLVEFVLKHNNIRNLAAFLEILFPWLNEAEFQIGSQLSTIVLRYVADQIDSDNEKLLIMKSEEYLSSTLRGEVMTLAQRWEQNGVEKGIQQEKHQIALKLLKRGMSLQEVAELSGLPLEAILAEQIV
jgi:predicted transposase/invertase (TIGR01784 family)